MDEVENKTIPELREFAKQQGIKIPSRAKKEEIKAEIRKQLELRKPKSPTPKPKSPTPKPKSPTPKPKSPTPQPKSPTPKTKSPKQKQLKVNLYDYSEKSFVVAGEDLDKIEAKLIEMGGLKNDRLREIGTGYVFPLGKMSEVVKFLRELQRPIYKGKGSVMSQLESLDKFLDNFDLTNLQSFQQKITRDKYIITYIGSDKDIENLVEIEERNRREDPIYYNRKIVFQYIKGNKGVLQVSGSTYRGD